ncbi:uncharacterized protein Z520_09221 [Fonsecaea multimorphosa CBS 102226]|uniref:Enoyl reductase (ER) domain-containing protein n=1 Tax=Fonsecaea multimorphosa CBS 102226 TaxID=1442371 RepID=A0A0D2ICT2_9EURO|nr:uncharacterized protein Z520_09221 [Fonsecaea multimorphosa CBS 102226]KIX94911.1 hypothetical protein Z520_09221 [Fonsecaea multimorphosa CBS 102226]OAL20563.1 hypothetical protein AYO22_08572 [Fonsecaea multimorphosa]
MLLQTVYRLTSRTGFDGLESFQEPVPTASKHDILIKVCSVALNFRDIAIATGTYPVPVKDNVVPCSDMAGEVVQVGDEVKGFAVGDLVIAPVSLDTLYGPVKEQAGSLGGSEDGVLRQYLTLQGNTAIKLPKSNHSLDEWAATVTAVYTVWNAFYGAMPLKPGDTVLALGTGGVSIVAVILAKAAGATTIITSSSDEKLGQVKLQYGVDHTINYKTYPKWAEEVMKITGGRGVDQVIEVGGVGTIEQSIASVANGGTISVIGFLASLPDDKMPNVTLQTLLKGANLRGVLGGSKQQLEEAVRFIAARNLPMPVTKTFPFTKEGILSAFQYVASGQHMGKVCISLG